MILYAATNDILMLAVQTSIPGAPLLFLLLVLLAIGAFVLLFRFYGGGRSGHSGGHGGFHLDDDNDGGWFGGGSDNDGGWFDSGSDNDGGGEDGGSD